MSSPTQVWRDELDAWALPADVIDSAPQSPWIHPPVLFDVPNVIASTPSHERARERLPEGGTVLDVGCGGGIAAFAVTPPATNVIGVDHQPEMLKLFHANATARGVSCQTVEGFWPNVAIRGPRADVATAHHVVYNVADIEPFLRALDDHAKFRVVLEMPDHHPLASMREAWRHFWNLERPLGPTPDVLLAVLADLGFDAHREQWHAPLRVEQDHNQRAHFMRIRLCLPESREGDVLEFLKSNEPPVTRQLSTLWWDVVSREE